MKQKAITWFIGSILVMVQLPFLAVQFVSSDAGRMVSILLLFVVNPLWAVITGIVGGKKPHILWFLPLAMDILFAIEFEILFGLDFQVLFYIGIYTVTGYVTMLITSLTNHKKAAIQKIPFECAGPGADNTINNSFVGEKRKWTAEEVQQWYRDTGAITYYNTRDLNIVVRKPNGYGWTVNWANPKAYLMQLCILIFVWLIIYLLHEFEFQ